MSVLRSHQATEITRTWLKNWARGVACMCAASQIAATRPRPSLITDAVASAMERAAASVQRDAEALFAALDPDRSGAALNALLDAFWEQQLPCGHDPPPPRKMFQVWILCRERFAIDSRMPWMQPPQWVVATGKTLLALSNRYHPAPHDQAVFAIGEI